MNAPSDAKHRRCDVNAAGQARALALGSVTFGRLVAAAIIAAALLLSAAPIAAAKGQEAGQVCTGTQGAGEACHPRALQATPLEGVPLGCKQSSGATVACGRRGYHEQASAGSAGPSAFHVSGPDRPHQS